MRPLCRCHGEPMLRNGLDKSYNPPRQDWRCAIERRQKARRTYEALEHVAYNKRLLQMRRACALWKRRQREEQRLGPLQGKG